MCQRLKNRSNERRPSCLMIGPETSAGIRVEVFIKEDKVLPVWIVKLPVTTGVTGASSRFIFKKQLRQSTPKLVSDLLDTQEALRCPHGRPTRHRIPKEDVARWFERTGWRRS